MTVPVSLLRAEARGRGAITITPDLPSVRRAAALVARGMERRRLAPHVVATTTHDWSHDPLSRGAYSYALVGGSEAARSLARPVGGTLFFAGEACDADGRTATVHGTIATGYRAAAQAHRALSRT